MQSSPTQARLWPTAGSPFPAGGSAQVKVEIQIPAKAVEHMKALGYANGFYVEGFVYVRPEADAEGALDVTHSIPVLGWYGNWTDPSMFDTGSYLEYAYGTLQRPSHINTNVKNAMTWCPQGLRRGPVLHRQHLRLLQRIHRSGGRPALLP